MFEGRGFSAINSQEMSANSEISAGRRFGFGANWDQFLKLLDDDRIGDAVNSLRDFLGVDDLRDQRFLDIGCGSGLFSLAARRLGASVTSFDFDPQSVACATELKRRYFAGDDNWTIEQGSALDRNYLHKLGKFDVVYSWGVLHHTGALWLGIENAIGRVEHENGKLFVAIYNDQGWKSHLWWIIKFLYNRMPGFLKAPYVFFVTSITRLLVILKYTIKLKPMVAISPLLRDRRVRGMSGKYDSVDWVGGFPYEFAEFDTLVEYFSARGFSIIKASRNTSLGCHELSLKRDLCAD